MEGRPLTASLSLSSEHSFVSIDAQWEEIFITHDNLVL